MNHRRWDIVAAPASPTDLTSWMPTIAAAGRPDLDIDTLTRRRAEFLVTALDHAGRGS